MMINEKLEATISQVTSAALLRIGDSYQKAGLLHQALGPYLKILVYYSGNREAEEAVRRVIAIAEMFEARGQPHMALSIYERMAWAVQQCRRWSGHPAPHGASVLDRELQDLIPERRSVPFPRPSGNGGLKEDR